MDYEPTEEPSTTMTGQTIGWWLAHFVPLLGWYAAVHLPTIWYKQGLKVGPKSPSRASPFTSFPALAAVMIAPLAAVFTIGLVAAVAQEGSEGPIAAPQQMPGDGTPSAIYPVGPGANPATISTPAANFTEFDAVRLTQAKVAENSRSWPADTHWVRCTSASYRSGNGLWVVTCEFRTNKDDPTPVSTKTYAFDDHTGQVR